MTDHTEFEERFLIQVSDLYKRKKKDFGELRENLQIIQRDLELISQKGYKLYFAVDFHQIFKFAFPISVFVPHPWSDVPRSSRRIRDINEHIARAFVFYGLHPRPILLPPHIGELEDLLDLFITKEIVFDIELDTLKRWGDKYFTSEQKQLIREAGEWFRKNPQGDPSREKWYVQLVRFLYANYRDLLYLTTGLITHGIDIINDLFYSSEPKVLLCEDVFPEHQNLIKQIVSSKVSKWFHLFQKTRGRWLPDIRDSKAIDIVCALNNAFIEDNRKERIFLISDAPSMYKVLNWDITDRILYDKKELRENNHPRGVINIEGNEIRLLRRNDTFLIYLLHRESDDLKTLERIRKSEDEVNRYFALEDKFSEIITFCKLCDYDCEACKPPKECRELLAELKKSFKFYESLQNIELLKGDKRQMIMEPYGIILNADVELEKSIRYIVDFLMNKSDSFEKLVDDERSKFGEVFENVMKNVQTSAKDISKALFLNIGYRLAGISGIPFRIQFQDEEISELIVDLISAVFQEEEKLDIEGIMKKSRLILKFRNNTQKGEDSHLLSAVLCYCYKRYRDAAQIAKDRLEEGDPKYRSEYLFIRIISYLGLSIEEKEKKIFQKTFEEVKKAYREHCVKEKADLRYFNLKAAIILEGIGHSLGEDLDIDEAIKTLRAGLEEMKKISNMEKYGEELKFTLINNYVYGIILKDRIYQTTREERRDAHQKMEELLEEFRDLSKYPDIQDTRVWFIILQMKYSDDRFEIENLYEYGNEIIKNVAKLAEKRQMPPYKLKIYMETREKLDRVYEERSREL